MKVKSFSAKMIAFILIVVVLASIIVTNTVKQNEIKEEILCGYTEIMDARLENFLDSTKTSYFDFPPSEYGERLGLTEITYEVTNIKKEDDIYVLSVDIFLICDHDNLENDNELLAHDVKYEFYDLQYDDFEIGGYECSYCSYKDLDYYNEELITVYVNGERILSPQKRDSNKNEGTVKCEVCGKRYKDTSDNATSIALTNMCTSCYEGYKWKQDIIDELPVG